MRALSALLRRDWAGRGTHTSQTPVYGLKIIYLVFSVQNPVTQKHVDGLNQLILYQTLPDDLLSETCISVFPSQYQKCVYYELKNSKFAENV